MKSRSLSVPCAMSMLAALAATASAQMTPIAATGWNRDIVVENTSVSPYVANHAFAYDTFNNWSWYEQGTPGTTKGLPLGGAFASLLDGTLAQLQPYTQDNALFLDIVNPTLTLNIDPADQIAYESIAIFASSSNGGGLGTMVINFTDFSNSGPLDFNAQDWFFVTANNALNNLGRMSLTTDVADDASFGNPRIYQTTINLAALGLSNRQIASIDFTKPNIAGASHNTVVMAISGLPAISQLDPIEVSGFNSDIVIENTATPPYSAFASPFDAGGNFTWYETGLPGSVKGLPVGGSFFSASNAAVIGQFAPYNQPNALMLTNAIPAGTLTLAPGDQRPYDLLAVFASTAGGGGLGSLVIHFSDATSSDPISFNAQDWFNVTTNNALNNLGRVAMNTDLIEDGSAGNPRIYQTILNLAGLGYNDRAVTSITFTKPASGSATAVMGVSGQAVAGDIGACTLPDGTCSLTLESNCSGSWAGIGTACPPAGACIDLNGDCTIRTQANCNFVGGTWQGAASVCPGNGACIAPNGDCAQLNSFQCAFQGGTFQGVGNPCPASGACCVGGSCVLLNSFQCDVQGGTFNGVGTNCLAGPAIGANSPGLAIPDNNLAGITDTIIVSDTTPMTDIYLTLNMNHTWIGDLTVTLTFVPDVGAQIGPIDIFNRPGRLSNTGFGSPADMISTGDYVFGDGGENLWAVLLTAPATVPLDFYSPSTNDGSSTSPPNGAFTTFAPFAGLSPAGAWTITVIDQAGGDLGNLNTWSINRGSCSDSGPDCPADWDGNDSVEVLDIFAFLTDWFAGDPDAQNFGGNPGVPAIFAFLTEWFGAGVGPC